MDKIKKYFADWTAFEKIWLVTSCLVMIGLSIAWQDSPLALLSGIAGIISVVLCAKGKLENYPFGLIQVTTYGYICYQAHIYGETMYNVVMVPIIIFGFFSWKKNMAQSGEEVQARNLTATGWILLIVGSIVAIFTYNSILGLLGGELTIVDSATTTLSLIAAFLMLARYSEQWILWIIVNVGSIILWVLLLMEGDSSAVTMIVMWCAYLINAIYGYVNWRKLANS